MPIIVSGLGGSGTRVLGQILQNAGVHIGNDLNESLDNLLFSLLFKRPHRFSAPDKIDSAYLNQCIDVFERASLAGDGRAVFEELPALMSDLLKDRYYGPFWLFSRLRKLSRKPEQCPVGGWGWKEPHAGYFFEPLYRRYPGAKFIVVMRNGLDMAYAPNDQQARYWCRFLDVPPCRTPAEKFNYWFLYNQYMKTTLTQLGAEFYMLRLEDLFLDAKPTLEHLMSTLDLVLNQQMVQLPRVPSTFCRFKTFDMGWVTADVYDKLDQLGYAESELEQWATEFAPATDQG